MKPGKINIIKATGLAVALLSPLLFFNNCQKFSAITKATDSSSFSLTSTKEEEALIKVLNRAADYAAKLENIKAQLKSKEQIETDVSKRNDLIEFQTLLAEAALELTEVKDQILNLLQVQRLAISSNEVLRAVDHLVERLGYAQYLELKVDIHRVEQESKERDQELANDIDALETEFAEFKEDVKKFKEQVNAKFNSIDDKIAALEARDELLNTMIQDLAASTEAADAALRLALADLKEFTEIQIVELTQLNIKLKEDILAQKQVLEELFAAEEGVASLAGRLCSTNSQGEISDSRAQCTGAEPNLYTGATCCLTIDAVNCSTLFPSEVQVSARNQCNILVSTVKNHDEQLKAIRQVDEKQTTLIAGLLEDVTNISKQLEILADGYDLLVNAVNAISAKLTDIDRRLLIVEFKAARAEAAAALNERADLNLAWVARRTTDISARFCHANVRQALDQFDYEAARQNWHYCHERLEFLTRAKELTQLAKAYTNGLQSVNVDTSCNAIINGKDAESLTNDELLDEEVFKQVQSKCTTGGAVVARAMMLNVVQLLGVVGPDFRTVQYMTKKAKIAQLLFFGKPISETSAAERAAFELTDPTDPAIAGTLYARVERAFKKTYVENRMRTLAGTFPERPSDMPENIAGFNVGHSIAAIQASNSPYMRRLASLEIEGECSDCGFEVERRINTDVQVSRGGKERFSYPKDIESLCPVHNDVVILQHANGKFYPYYLNYNWLYEEFKPYLRSGVHAPIANSQADVNNGNFAYCGRHADYLVNRVGLGVAQLRSRLMLTLTQPYGKTYAGRGQCVHSTLVCVMRNQEWIAPSGSGDLISYLSNYSNSVLQPQCTYNEGSGSTVRTRLLKDYEQKRIRTFASVADQASINLRNKVNSSTTQLTGDYWTLRDNVLNYGVGNQAVSKTEPFFGSAQSHVDQFVRAHHALTGNVSVQECTPGD